MPETADTAKGIPTDPQWLPLLGADRHPRPTRRRQSRDKVRKAESDNERISVRNWPAAQDENRTVARGARFVSH